MKSHWCYDKSTRLDGIYTYGGIHTFCVCNVVFCLSYLTFMHMFTDNLILTTVNIMVEKRLVNQKVTNLQCKVSSTGSVENTRNTARYKIHQIRKSMIFLPCATLQDDRKFPNLHDTGISFEVVENFCGKSWGQPTWIDTVRANFSCALLDLNRFFWTSSTLSSFFPSLASKF